MSKYMFGFKPAKKKKKKKKYDEGRSYASFWLDRDTNIAGRDMSSMGTGSASIVKAIKLRSYHRAVSNFVKILTNKEIPVKFHNGKDSFTNGKEIYITSKIDHKNFDVVVGLALHEASHVKLTDFRTHIEYWDKLIERRPELYVSFSTQLFKNLVNWIEDRRIDNYIFKTSPGYKAYYHKLYDHYFNSPDIDALFAEPIRYEENIDNYMFHLINMTNSNFNPNALPGLADITKLIDLPNIARLQSTYDVCEVAEKVLETIIDRCTEAQLEQQKQEANEPSASNDHNGERDGQNNETNENKDDNRGNAPTNSGNDNSNDAGNSDSNPNEDSELRELTPEEKKMIQDALRKQRDFIEHNSTWEEKATADKKLQKQLENINDMDVEVHSTGGDVGSAFQTLVYNLTKDRKFWNSIALAKSTLDENKSSHYMDEEFSKLVPEIDAWPYNLQSIKKLVSPRIEYVKSLEEGKLLGNQLGKKLRLVNESRELIHNRLKTGSIDRRRVSCLGYEIETVFNQIHMDQYKGANLHISLDASGSMGGVNWANAIKMTMAIATACKTTQSKISLQVSFRGTAASDKIAETILIYDSKYNTLQNLYDGLLLNNLCSITPEGLCFESMYKSGIFKASSNEMDSYLLNISDGEPNMNSSKYSGMNAAKHARIWVDKCKSNLNMHVLSYFVSGSKDSTIDNCSSGRTFKAMYGRDARMVDPSSLIQLAKTLNDKFLAAKVTV